MINEILSILQKRCEIRANHLLLVGLSGGPDSLCLLQVLYQAGYQLYAVHVNHRLRAEADDEARQVEDFAHQLGVNFVSRTVDVGEYSREYSVSIEEAARVLRYRILFEQAQDVKAAAVAVGHTADDQVETILMHLLRGTGLVGLRGMEYRMLPNPWSMNIPLVRPLLSTWRTDILQYIAEYGLHPISDRSNLDVSYFRNRLRHELLPLLENYNPSIREALFRMGQSLKDDYSLLQQMVDAAWQSTLVQQGESYITFRTKNVLELPISIQRYLMRKAIGYYLPGLRDVGFDCIERGLSMLAGEIPGSATDLIAGLRLVKQGENFHVLKSQSDPASEQYPAIKSNLKQVLVIPSVLELERGWQLQAEEIQNPITIDLQSRTNQDPFQAWLDLSGVDLPLVARSRHPGDKIRLLGLNGHATKISDLMINIKLPKRARLTWPLICSGQEVLWVPGYRLSHLVRIKPETVKAVHLSLTCRQTA